MKTKKIISLFLILLLLVLTLTACDGNSKLKGTYRSQDVVAQTFTFDGEQVSMSAFGLNAIGTYEIKEDKISIFYNLFGMEYTWEQPFSQSGDTINIGGTEFKKD